ncbi:MAG: hypothetical protein AABY98_05290, partial [Candidatus Deferrimicrobiota bacterium]
SPTDVATCRRCCNEDFWMLKKGVAGVQIFEAFEKIGVGRANPDGEGLSTVIILYRDRMITWTVAFWTVAFWTVAILLEAAAARRA